MRALLLPVLGASLSLLGCFQAKAKQAWYRCDNDSQCAAGQSCDDGLCCDPNGGLPWCPTQAYLRAHNWSQYGRQSDVIRGHQRSSEAIRGHQRTRSCP